MGYILLYCYPALNILTVNALVAAGKVIFPVESYVLALGGLGQLLETVQTVKAILNANLELAGILT